jgi:hypothetical protein
MDPEQRVAMGRNGRLLVATDFSWEKLGVEMRRVCEWAAYGGETPGCVRGALCPRRELQA